MIFVFARTRNSPLGQDYVLHKAENVFYRDATFYSADDVAKLLVQAGFSIDDWGQTLAHSLSETHFVEPLQPGYGQCAFVVVCAKRKK